MALARKIVIPSNHFSPCSEKWGSES